MKFQISTRKVHAERRLVERARFHDRMGRDTTIYQDVDFGQFMASLDLILPMFAEYRGMVFRTDAFSEAGVEEWLADESLAATDIEKVINHCHLWDVFEQLPTISELETVGKILAASWIGAARMQFPDYDFVCSFQNEPDDYGPTLTIWRVRTEIDPTKLK